MKCKALTLTQPWASLVMLGEKRVETRSVCFSYRGLLYIHSSLKVDVDAWNDPIFQTVLRRHGITRVEQLLFGKVLGSVEVVDGCRFIDEPFPGCMPVTWFARLGLYERNFGDYRPGRGGLLLESPKPLVESVAARGMNGLWNWDDAAVAATRVA
jgi:activating signal cointegrator 1